VIFIEDYESTLKKGLEKIDSRGNLTIGVHMNALDNLAELRDEAQEMEMLTSGLSKEELAPTRRAIEDDYSWLN
jgi:hypothetical protein